MIYSVLVPKVVVAFDSFDIVSNRLWKKTTSTATTQSDAQRLSEHSQVLKYFLNKLGYDPNVCEQVK